jgi:F-type H+-transporting ATPase subunit b
MTHLILFGSIGSDLAKTGSDTAETFGLDWPHFIAQVVSFSIVAFLLVRFAYKPILTVLQERRQRIAEGLANADKIKQELARTEAMQREVLEKANIQATKLIEEARAAAARVQEQETQKAIAQAEQIITKAREATVLERERMLTELKREVVGLVVHVASATTGKILTAEDQQRLAEETRRQLAA